MNASVMTTVSIWVWICLAGGVVLASEESSRLTPEQFAILPWGWTPGEKDVLETIWDCGFNLAGFVGPDHLDAVSAAGLKCILSDPSIHVSDSAGQMDPAEIEQRVQAVVERIQGHEALFGYYLRDEPGANAYPGLRAFRDALNQADPNAAAYINLFPNYASPAQMGVSTYREYVESFVDVVQPAYISYDHYALMEDGSLREGYFQNLEIVRDVALRHGLPFWNIVLSNAHFKYAEPTDAGFRFQLYTTLAYGGRGISYFTYFTPAVGNYRLGPIDPFGHKTPTWDMLRNVNLQLHRLGPIYITLKNLHVFHHPHVPEGCHGLETSLYLDSLAGQDLLVGEFEGPKKEAFIMVVNKNLFESSTFMPTFKEGGRQSFVNAYTGKVTSWSGENNWLAPGQGMLLVHEPAKP